ncbi:MAG TPA: hypothetical protein VFC19_41215, partial [Candidatus Limnocylindrales bacterium]|nr:hypothetical protein [Candidatus Limnocylindrales bacterium]
MNGSILLSRLALVAALGAATALSVPTPAAAADQAGLSSAVAQAIRQTRAGTERAAVGAAEAIATSHYVMRTDKSGRWAFGSAVLAPA